MRRTTRTTGPTPHRPRRSTLRTAALALLVSSVVVSLSGPGAAQARPAPAAAGSASDSSPRGCAHQVLDRPTPARTVAARQPQTLAAAAAANGRGTSALRALAQDRTLWLDRCGKEFYVERRVADAGASAATTAAAAGPASATATVPLADTFTLQSRPGAARTIYLDFTGGTVTGTAWNSSYGASIAVEPFSITAPADTAFSDAELTEIQRAWQVVAEDYAPFDVNVTTQDPGVAAIDRSSSTDQVYGAHVMLTNAGPIYTGCGCGGVAYVNVFNTSGSNHLYYQPAWVFSAGTTTSGKNMGEAAAHEAGHNLGLSHDATATSGYYTGASPWAPIMGAAYSQPVSQWSRGEYPGANNLQDDLAILATGVPFRTDDHGDLAASATPLVSDVTVPGVISTPSDDDAFAVTAYGATTVSVTPAAGLPDLDVQLHVVDSSGATVAIVNPAVARVSSSVATGLGATWSTTAPAGGASYTVYVDGVGSGDPAVAGGYSDYGSLGNYQITLTTQTPSQVTPLSATAAAAPNAVVGRPYAASPVTVSGGVAPYGYAASGLPAGLALGTDGRVTGTPTAAGTATVDVTVTDAAGATAHAGFTLQVDPAPVAPVVVADQTLAAGRVGSAYAQQVVGSGGDGTLAWTATGLPAGLVLSSSGVLSGTPTVAGTTTFTATATSAGVSDSGLVTITISPAALAFATGATLPTARVGVAYATTIAIGGGVAPYTWTRSGTLPAGLTLTVAADGLSARLTGKPTARTKYAFTLTVRDGAGTTVSRRFSLTVTR